MYIFVKISQQTVDPAKLVSRYAISSIQKYVKGKIITK